MVVLIVTKVVCQKILLISVLISVPSMDQIHDYSEFRADGLRSALKSSTVNKIRMFTSWMGTKMTDGVFELDAEDLLALTREQFNDFGQTDMIRMVRRTSSLTTTWTNYTYDHLVWIYKRDCNFWIPSCSQNSRRVPREMHQHIAFLRMTSIMTPSRDSS